jgi:hypothetical protein
MSIAPNKQIQLDETSFQSFEKPHFDPQEKEWLGNRLGLDQVFNEDSLKQASQKFVSQAVETEELTPSFWNKFLAWLKGATTTSPSVDTEPLNTNPLKPLSPIPTLEPPENIPIDLQGVKFPPLSKKGEGKSKLTPSEIMEGVSRLSEQTIESVLFIIYKAQMELEKKNAQIADGTFSKYLAFQKLQEKALVEIKDVLVKDENFANYFKTAQNIVLAATIVAGLAAATISCGFLPSLAGLVTSLAGATAGNLFRTIVGVAGSTGPFVTAGLTALTEGTRAYFKRRANEHRAEHEEYQHKDQYYNDCVDDARNRLMKIAEMDNTFKERWILLLKRTDKMRKIVLKK